MLSCQLHKAPALRSDGSVVLFDLQPLTHGSAIIRTWCASLHSRGAPQAKGKTATVRNDAAIYTALLRSDLVYRSIPHESRQLEACVCDPSRCVIATCW